MARKANQTSFKKGDPSPNPGGRPKKLAEVEALAAEHTVSSIKTLVEIRDDLMQPGVVRARCAEYLIDRAWGRPRQSIEATIDPSVGLRALTDAQLEEAIVEELRQLREATKVSGASVH